MYTHFGSLISLLGVTASVVAAQDATPTVTIGSGPIVGKETSHPDSDTAVNQFLGIPFAEPPLQDRRFQPPQEIASWDTPLEVKQQPNACRQWLGPPGAARERRIALFYHDPQPAEDEDCLYLNVYVPQGGETNKSVLFWIYGGSGYNGAVSLPIYDGTSFAANQDIIVVAANYRINVFGNPTAPQLSPEERNLGQLDIRLALDWTRRNVAAFGGDPDKVTIMGESAGAMAVGNLINTLSENPLFRAGVMMSGSSVAAPQGVEDYSAESDQWSELMELINCTGLGSEEELECARAADVEAIVEAINYEELTFSGSGPDNLTVLERPDLAWANGNVARVPVLIGSNADEGSYYALSAVENVDGDIVEELGVGGTYQLLFDVPDDVATTLDQAYSPGSPFAEGANTTLGLIAQVATDWTFRCTSGFVANLTANLLDQPTWQYRFDAVVPSNSWPEWPELGAYHASEIALIFGTYSRNGNTEVEAALSRSLQKQFADFVKDPESGPGWEQWPTIGILGVNATGPVTTTRDAEESEAVCAYYYPFYLASLPALAEAGGSGLGANGTESEPESESEGSESASEAARPGLNAAFTVACWLVIVLI